MHHADFFCHLVCARLKKVKSLSLCTWLCHRFPPENATLSSSQPSTAPSMYKHLPGEQEVRFNRCVENTAIILKRLSQLRRFYRIPIRIPKSCRIPVAEALAYAVDRTLTSVSNVEWNSLVLFPIIALGIPISPNTTGSSLFHHPC